MNLDIDCPDPQINELVLFVTVGLYIFIIKPFEGLALNIFEGFHAFFVAVFGMDVGKPGHVSLLYGCFEIESCEGLGAIGLQS